MSSFKIQGCTSADIKAYEMLEEKISTQFASVNQAIEQQGEGDANDPDSPIAQRNALESSFRDISAKIGACNYIQSATAHCKVSDVKINDLTKEKEGLAPTGRRAMVLDLLILDEINQKDCVSEALGN